jgi:hypothetical protein
VLWGRVRLLGRVRVPKETGGARCWLGGTARQPIGITAKVDKGEGGAVASCGYDDGWSSGHGWLGFGWRKEEGSR